MVDADSAVLEDPAYEPRRVVAPLSPWEVALHSISQLAVVFALSLALILILGHSQVIG